LKDGSEGLDWISSESVFHLEIACGKKLKKTDMCYYCRINFGTAWNWHSLVFLVW
jgi:hypothetical protein